MGSCHDHVIGMVFFVLYKSWLYEFHFNLWCMSIVIFDELIRHAIVRYNYCNRTWPPPHPLPQLEYIYQAQGICCRIVGFSIICSRAQQWLKLEIVSVFLFIAIKPMFRSFKKGYSYIVCPKIYPEFIFCLIVWYL